MTVCKIDGCHGTNRMRRGWCNKHYLRWKRYGDPLAGRTFHMSPSESCTADRCALPPSKRGLCEAHYKRQWKASRPPGCSVDGCVKPHDTGGLCSTHSGRYRRHGDPSVRLRQRHDRCTFDECGRPHEAQGFCATHYHRWRTYGDPSHVPVFIPAPCQLEGCDRDSQCRCLCANHYVQIHSGPAYRARRRNAPGVWDGQAVEARIAFYGAKCWVCRAPYEQLDHVKPLIAGGANWPSNIRPICTHHNTRKKGRWLGPSRLKEVV